jgi:hypothetical protein
LIDNKRDISKRCLGCCNQSAIGFESKDDIGFERRERTRKLGDESLHPLDIPRPDVK